jgi:hypothetical protein
MTFDDLPRDWPHRPLTEPRFVADVLDLVVTGRSRAEGALYVLLCRSDDRLAQPCAVTDVPVQREELTHREILQPFAAMMRQTEPAGSMLVAIARPGPLVVGDDDRAWHQAAIDVCADGPRLLGVHVVTEAGSVSLTEFERAVSRAS